MKSLYLKVLAWFLVTVAVTGFGLWWVTSLNWTRAEQSLPPFRRVAQLEFELARRSYEQGGKPELAKHQEWVRSRANFSGMLTDANGIDLVTGDSYADAIERLKADKVGAGELEKVRNQILAAFYRQLKTIAGKANLLGQYDIYFGGYAKLFDFDKLIAAVTAEDVQRVAAKYLTERNRTVATLVPTKGEKVEAN